MAQCSCTATGHRSPKVNCSSPLRPAPEARVFGRALRALFKGELMAAVRPPVAYVGVTDRDWLEHLQTIRALDEVNFWQPSPHGFAALKPGEPFLFKLHARHSGRIGGLAFFLRYTVLPVSMAWEAFGEKNGAGSPYEMQQRIARYRRTAPSGHFVDYEIGCIILTQPVFFREIDWFDAPDWKPNIQTGWGYRLDGEAGRLLWSRAERAIAGAGAINSLLGVGEEAARYGSPVFVRPRLGQGSFQTAVLDAYARRCSISQEKVVPALEAAHIRPYGLGGEHRVDNGLLLRRDIHALFDRGYITVTPSLEVIVSSRLKHEFDNGEEYGAFNGSRLRPPWRLRMCRAENSSNGIMTVVLSPDNV